METKQNSRLKRLYADWTYIAFLLLCLVMSGICLGENATRKVVSRTAPNFPELARKMRLSGKARVEATVNPSGTVTAASLVGGNPVFESAAIEAVKQWKFEPGPSVTKIVVVLEFVDQ